MYDSNKANKIKLFDLKRDEISKIYCFSITFEDISIITGQKYFFNDLSIEFIERDLLTISFKNLKLLSMLFPQPIVFLNYIFLRNHFLYQACEFILYSEELDLMGLYLNGELMKDYSGKKLLIMDRAEDIRNYYLTEIYKNKPSKRIINRLIPFFTKYKRFLQLIDLISNLSIRYASEFCIYLLCLRENEIRSFNNRLVKNKIRFEKKYWNKTKKAEIGQIYSLHEFETFLFISISYDKIKNINIHTEMLKIPKEIKPKNGFKLIYIFNMELKSKKVRIKKYTL